MSIISERADGTWNRVIAAGVKPNQFLISHFLEGFIIMIIQFGEYYCYISFMLSTELTLSGTLITSALVFMTGICGLIFGLFVSIVTKSVMASFSCAQFFVYPMIFLSGKLNLTCNLSEIIVMLFHFRFNLAYSRPAISSSIHWLLLSVCICY
jgi:ABC-2 type transporter